MGVTSSEDSTHAKRRRVSVTGSMYHFSLVYARGTMPPTGETVAFIYRASPMTSLPIRGSQCVCQARVRINLGTGV